MIQSGIGPNLANRQYISLIVRLTLDQRGRMVQGELLDTNDTIQKRFNGPSALNRAVEAWLKAQEAIAPGPEL